jgi:two-component system, NarL family, nitrate/nitrite response regulator NarL
MKIPLEQHLLEAQRITRIVIADDHGVVRSGVKSMLGHEAGLLVIGEAEDGESALAMTKELQPDIILLDLHMPRLSGMMALRAILREAPRVKPILLAGTVTPLQAMEGLEAGARGILEKTSIAEDLIRSIRAVQSGEYWFNGEQASNPIEMHRSLKHRAMTPKRKTYGLTPRELSTVQCISEGCSNKDMAKELSISVETVKRHVSSVFDKTGVSTRLELAMFAIAHKLVVLETV